MINEEKQRFIAQYFATDAKWFNSACPGHELVWDKKNFFQIDETDYLLLKCPSEITEDDAIEVSRILDSEFDVSTFTDYARQFHINRGKSHILPSRHCRSDVADFMRKNGYVMPYLKYSVKDLQEMGWIMTNKTQL